MSRLSRILRIRLKKVRLRKLRSIKWFAGIIFVISAWYVIDHTPTTEIAWVTGLLFFTIYLFVFEIVNVDEAAITIMVLLGLSSLMAPAMGLEQGLVDTQHIFDGFEKMPEALASLYSGKNIGMAVCRVRRGPYDTEGAPD